MEKVAWGVLGGCYAEVEGGRMGEGESSMTLPYLVFEPKLSTHHMHDSRSIVPHIRIKSVHR
jgi:hypothetical protein